MHKDVQTAQDLEIIKQTLHNKLSPALLDSSTLPEPYFYEPLFLESLFGQQLDPLVIQQIITNVQINHYNIQPSYTLVDIPWWLPLLETPFQHILDEHNNFSPNYL
ncbi:2586_t:CDS:2, partial [Cetraspora pellucida]